MRYKNVRLITKTKAIDVLNSLTEQIDDGTMKDIIQDADINKTYGDIVYIGWKYIETDSVELIESSMYELEEQNLSYRLTIIGDYDEEIEESHYTSPEDEEKNIPYPSIIRSFDEKDMEEQLEGYENYIKSSLDKEMSDYEPSI